MIRKRVKDYVAGAQSYLDWHRTLDPGFHMTDIDSVEVTPSGVPLVFIELKKIRHRQPSLSYYLNLISEVYVRQAPIGKLFLYLSKVLPLQVSDRGRTLRIRRLALCLRRAKTRKRMDESVQTKLRPGDGKAACRAG
jgi:hypothetical protein